MPPPSPLTYVLLMSCSHEFPSPRVVTTGSIDKGDDHAVGEGDYITLSTDITNHGNTCLHGIDVTDDRNTPMVCKPPYSGKPLRSTLLAHGQIVATCEVDLIVC